MHVAAPAELNWPQAQSTQAVLELCPAASSFLPSTQAVHATCAWRFCQRPGGQLVQATASTDEAAALVLRNLPALHASQLVCACKFWYRPEGQLLHATADVCASDSKNVPSWHGEPLHVARPSSSWCLPTGQLLQLVWAGWFWKRPRAQSVQLDPSTYLPAMQLTQLSAPAFDSWPAGHVWHVFALEAPVAEEYLLAAQLAHAVAPVEAAYLPPGQALHSASTLPVASACANRPCTHTAAPWHAVCAVTLVYLPPGQLSQAVPVL